jgi:hypothetical protein
VGSHLWAYDAVGYIPVGLPFLHLIGKAGIAHWDVNRQSWDGLDYHNNQFTWDAGAQAHFGALGVRLEYEKFVMSNTANARAVTLGVSFTFL